MAHRQKLLVLYLASSALDTPVIGWARYDGLGGSAMTGDQATPPYKTGIAALEDGWRLIQASPLTPHFPGIETQTSYLKYEFWFEQWLDLPSGTDTRVRETKGMTSNSETKSE